MHAIKKKRIVLEMTNIYRSCCAKVLTDKHFEVNCQSSFVTYVVAKGRRSLKFFFEQSNKPLVSSKLEDVVVEVAGGL